MSFRLRVLQALTETLKGVEFSVGAETFSMADYTDVAGRAAERVFRGRARFGDSDPQPMLSILEDFKAPETQLGPMANTKGYFPFPILIQGFIKDDPNHPTDPAYPFAAAVMKVLADERAKTYNILGFGAEMPCVTELKMSAPVIRPPDGEISTVAFFYLTLTLTLVEDFQDP